MNDRQTHPDAGHGEIPTDLAAVARAVDRLAALDAGSAPADLSDRVFASTRTAMVPLPGDVAPIAAKVETLATSEQRAAPPSLEAEAFELSREAVASGRTSDVSETLRFVDAPPARTVTVRRNLAVWSMRAAAVLVLGTVGFLILPRTTPTPPRTVAVERTAAELSATIQAEFESLFEAMGNGHQEALSDPIDFSADPDISWIDDLLTKDAL